MRALRTYRFLYNYSSRSIVYIVSSFVLTSLDKRRIHNMSTTSTTIAMEQLSLLDDITLHEDDLTQEAKSRFNYHTDILNSFETYRHMVLGDKHFSRAGRHLLLSYIGKLHSECKRVLNYMAENSELLSRNLPVFGPVVICGLPRTGTTLLYNLLACDPNSRALLCTEMLVESVPPISRSDVVEQERRAAIDRFSSQYVDILLGGTVDIKSAHAKYVNEEDGFILGQAGFLITMSAIVSDNRSESDIWLSDEMKKDFIYDYHETFLHMLNSVDPPRSHWLLKTPLHLFYLDTLLRHYPNAALIMTHRSFDDSLPSFCQLLRKYRNMHLNNVDLTSSEDALTTQKWLQLFNKMVECLIKFRTRQGHLSEQEKTNIFDVTYDDLMKNPILTVQRIYDRFGLHWSDEFKLAMQSWLQVNPQGKQGRHSYSLDEFGLKREDVQTRYADYTNMFLRSPSSDITNNNQCCSIDKQVEDV
jgi:hypothetical protein